MRTIVIIPAGGSGKRCGDALPKQYYKVHGREIIAYTIDIFQKNKQVDEIVISAQPDYFDLIREIAEKNGFYKLKKIVEGGSQRQDSVFNALNQLSCNDNDLIAVHDAARPLLDQNILSDALTAAVHSDGVLVCIPARDTLVKGQNEKIVSYLDRNEVFYAQTPQIFKYSVLKKSMDRAYKEKFYGTDESMLVKRAGNEVKLIEGSILNFKITTKPDLEIFQKLHSSFT